MFTTTIVTSDPDAIETVVKPVWDLSLSGRHVATVYVPSIALDWFGSGRCDAIELGRVVRLPQNGGAS